MAESSQQDTYPAYVPPPDASPSQPAVDAPFEVIRLDEILGVVDVQKRREDEDASRLQQIANPNLVDIRNRLVQWGSLGFVGSCTLFSIAITTPERCSDGVVRSLSEYIQFVSGKTIYEHLDLLRLRLPDFVVSFVYLMGNVIEFRASKV
jgi:hypothetical protein